MASNFKFTRNTTDKISVKGLLSDDGSEITYLDENKDEQLIAVLDCMNAFAGKYVEFNLSQKSEEDLAVIQAE